MVRVQECRIGHLGIERGDVIISLKDYQRSREFGLSSVSFTTFGHVSCAI